MSGSVDLDVARWFADHRNEHVTRVSRLLEDLGTSAVFFLVVGLVALAVVAVLRLWSGLPNVVAAMLVTTVVTGPLKDIFDRSRPPADLALTVVSGPAMPSSHAVFTSAAVVSVLMAPWWRSRTLHRLAAAVGIVGCLVVAAAMVYLGGHWLSDVLVGWALGAGISAAVMLLSRRVRRREKVICKPGITSPPSGERRMPG